MSKKWRCLICGVEFDGDTPPDICPVCGAPADQFEEVIVEGNNFVSTILDKIIILGNGAAGYYAAKAIRERNKDCSINIISKEKNITYYRPMLSDYLSSNLKDEEFYLSSESWYKENNIELTLDREIVEVLPDESTLIFEDGSELKYDKLILANGSSAFLPPIMGWDKQGVFTLKYLKDADKIKETAENSKKVVVIGGGLLGLEAAWEFNKMGLDVTVVEHNKKLLGRQLDEEGSELFKTIADKSGINFLLGASVREILGDLSVEGVKFDDGTTLNTNIVLFSTGIRSNLELPKKAGIKTVRGVTVNEKMQTNIDNIFAAGDVAEFNNRVYGNWPAAVEMGKVAGANACGDNLIFTDFVSSNIFSAMNTEIFTFGSMPLEGYEEIKIKDTEKSIYKKLFFQNDKLVGGICIGDITNSGKLLDAMINEKSKAEVSKDNLI